MKRKREKTDQKIRTKERKIGVCKKKRAKKKRERCGEGRNEEIKPTEKKRVKTGGD